MSKQLCGGRENIYPVVNLVPVHVAALEVSALSARGEAEPVPTVHHPQVVKHAAVPRLHPGVRSDDGKMQTLLTR